MKKVLANILFLALVWYLVAKVIIFPVVDFYNQYGFLWALLKLAVIIFSIIVVYFLIIFILRNL